MERREGRADFQSMTYRLLYNSASYELRARIDDDLCINETSIIHTQEQAYSVLHSRWQEEGHIDRLSKEECEALARAGYAIQRDRDGYWAWWREKAHQHLWLTVDTTGWVATFKPNMQNARWKSFGRFDAPVVPYFAGEYTSVGIVREALTTTIIALREYLPERVMSIQFFNVVQELCEEVITGMEADRPWLQNMLNIGSGT